jgi:hypothetical protein
MKKYMALMAMVVLSACAPVMEANRPDPVDLSQFAVGEDRMDIVAAIGSPVSTIKDKGHSCDVYKLYTDGPSGGGKGAIAAGEVVADVLTLGLTEIVFTPVEAGTKSDKHAVIFCYSKDDKMISMKKSDSASGSE